MSSLKLKASYQTQDASSEQNYFGYAKNFGKEIDNQNEKNGFRNIIYCTVFFHFE